MQMLITIDNKKESSASETIWTSNGFFGDQRSDLTLSKENFLENTIIYLNQGLVTNLLLPALDLCYILCCYCPNFGDKCLLTRSWLRL